MRILRDIRSDSVTVVDYPPGAATSIALVPFSVMLLLCWLGTPTWGGGRWVVTGALGAVIAAVGYFAWPRRRIVEIRSGDELRWEACLDGDDPYRVALLRDGEATPLLEHDDPAVVLTSVRQIAEKTGAIAQGPPWLLQSASVRGLQRAHWTQLSVVGLASNGQLRTAAATSGASLFVLVVFLISVKTESGLSLLSAALPLASVAVTGLLGAALWSLRIRASLGPDGLVAERVLFGRPTRLLRAPAETIRGVYSIGHSPHPERHLLVDTSEGPRAVALAGNAARRLAAQVSPARTTAQPEPERRPLHRNSPIASISTE